MDEMSTRQRIAELGPFFSLDPPDVDGDWRPVTDLLHGPVLAERVQTTAAALARSTGDVEARVAASTMSLGLFARLLSPSVGAAVLDLPGPSVDGLQWSPVRSGTMPLRAAAWSGDALWTVLDDLIGPLVEHLVAEHGLPDTVARGNASSAAVTAARMTTMGRPDLRASADRLTTDLLGTRLLAGTELRRHPYVRRSCCLYYRLPGGGYCGDCVLTTR